MIQKRKFSDINENSTTSYTNTEFILKSMIDSLKSIEKDEINALLEPQEYIYSYYAKVNALYSLMGFFINDKFNKNNKIFDVEEELINIKKRLYNKQFIKDITNFNKQTANKKNEDNLIKEYDVIITKTTNVLRHMTFEFSRMGMFFQINEKQTVSGLVR